MTAYMESRKNPLVRKVKKELKEHEKELNVLNLDAEYATVHGKKFSKVNKRRIEALYGINTNLRNKIGEVEMIAFKDALAKKHNLTTVKIDILFNLAWDLTPYHGGSDPHREDATKDWNEVAYTFDRIAKIL